jgi:sporulation protein YlmC with PRC-barrel domain
LVRQPAPVVTIDIPKPEIIVRMPQPEVSVSQPQPQVAVEQAQPEVQVVQPEKPKVQVEEGGEAQVQLTEEGQAQVQLEQIGEAAVTYEQAEPQVTINQEEGQPEVQIEQIEGGEQERSAAAAGLRDSEDPNQLPEQREAGEQQATATQAGQPSQAAGEGEMQAITASELEGKQVFNERGEQIGEVENLVRSTADDQLYVVIDHGGFMEFGEKTVALSLEGLLLQGDRIIVPQLSNEEIAALPEFQAGDRFPEVEDNEEAEIRVIAQQ